MESETTVLQENGPLEDEVMAMAELAVDVLGYTEITSLHLNWFTDLLTSKRLLFLAPRSHFKTTCISIIYPIYRVLRNKSVRILIINEILENSKAFLLEIKSHFQYNDDFKNTYGKLDENSPAWTAHAISVECERISKDPTISVAGIGGTIVSKHCDLIIVDDPVSMKNSETIGQRNKLKRWFFQTLLPILEPDGQLIVTGTRWHHADLYGEILTENKYPNWTKRVHKAEYEDGTILFPERFTKQKLDELRIEMGTAFYNSQYLNDPSGLEGQKFKRDWLKFYQTEPKTLYVYQGVDLAISKTDQGAYFAMVTIGIPPEGDIYVLNVVRERLDFPQQIRTVKEQVNSFTPILCAIEGNAYQDALPQVLQSDPEAGRLPIKSVKTYGEKERRLTSLACLFESGKIKVREDEHHLIDEFLAFPKGGTFDILDALLLAIEASRSQEVEPTIMEIKI